MFNTNLHSGLETYVMGRLLVVDMCTLQSLQIPTMDVTRIFLLLLNVAMGTLLLILLGGKLRDALSLWLAIIEAESSEIDIVTDIGYIIEL